MSVSTLVFVIAAFAIAACTALFIGFHSRRDGMRAKNRETVGSETQDPAASVCGAIEAAFDCGAFLFDAGYGLLHCGAVARLMTNESGASRHVIDILPPDAAHAILKRHAEIRRSSTLRFRCGWNSLEREVIASCAGEHMLVLVFHGRSEGGVADVSLPCVARA